MSGGLDGQDDHSRVLVASSAAPSTALPGGRKAGRSRSLANSLQRQGRDGRETGDQTAGRDRARDRGAAAAARISRDARSIGGRVQDAIKAFESEDIMVRGHTTQPIAYGLVAIKLTTIIEGEQGSNVLDQLENKIRTIENVSRVETEAVSLL